MRKQYAAASDKHQRAINEKSALTLRLSTTEHTAQRMALIAQQQELAVEIRRLGEIRVRMRRKIVGLKSLEQYYLDPNGNGIAGYVERVIVPDDMSSSDSGASGAESSDDAIVSELLESVGSQLPKNAEPGDPPPPIVQRPPPVNFETPGLQIPTNYDDTLLRLNQARGHLRRGQQILAEMSQDLQELKDQVQYNTDPSRTQDLSDSIKKKKAQINVKSTRVALLKNRVVLLTNLLRYYSNPEQITTPGEVIMLDQFGVIEERRITKFVVDPLQFQAQAQGNPVQVQPGPFRVTQFRQNEGFNISMYNPNSGQRFVPAGAAPVPAPIPVPAQTPAAPTYSPAPYSLPVPFSVPQQQQQQPLQQSFDDWDNDDYGGDDYGGNLGVVPSSPAASVYNLYDSGGGMSPAGTFPLGSPGTPYMNQLLSLSGDDGLFAEIERPSQNQQIREILLARNTFVPVGRNQFESSSSSSSAVPATATATAPPPSIGRQIFSSSTHVSIPINVAPPPPSPFINIDISSSSSSSTSSTSTSTPVQNQSGVFVPTAAPSPGDVVVSSSIPSISSTPSQLADVQLPRYATKATSPSSPSFTRPMSNSPGPVLPARFYGASWPNVNSMANSPSTPPPSPSSGIPSSTDAAEYRDDLLSGFKDHMYGLLRTKQPGSMFLEQQQLLNNQIRDIIQTPQLVLRTMGGLKSYLLQHNLLQQPGFQSRRNYPSLHAFLQTLLRIQVRCYQQAFSPAVRLAWAYTCLRTQIICLYDSTVSMFVNGAIEPVSHALLLQLLQDTETVPEILTVLVYYFRFCAGLGAGTGMQVDVYFGKFAELLNTALYNSALLEGWIRALNSTRLERQVHTPALSVTLTRLYNMQFIPRETDPTINAEQRLRLLPGNDPTKCIDSLVRILHGVSMRSKNSEDIQRATLLHETERISADLKQQMQQIRSNGGTGAAMFAMDYNLYSSMVKKAAEQIGAQLIRYTEQLNPVVERQIMSQFIDAVIYDFQVNRRPDLRRFVEQVVLSNLHQLIDQNVLEHMGGIIQTTLINVLCFQSEANYATADDFYGMCQLIDGQQTRLLEFVQTEDIRRNLMYYIARDDSPRAYLMVQSQIKLQGPGAVYQTLQLCFDCGAHRSFVLIAMKLLGASHRDIASLQAAPLFGSKFAVLVRQLLQSVSLDPQFENQLPLLRDNVGIAQSIDTRLQLIELHE